MTKQDLAALGLTEEVVLENLVQRLFEWHTTTDEEYANDFSQRLEKAVRAKVEERIDAAMNQHVLPKITEMVDGVCLQNTNEWGEKRGTPLTFVEYLTQRVDAYIREEVNYEGKPKSDNVYGWSKRSTRIAHMIHEHLQYSIERAMVAALGEVNSSVRKGLEEAVKHAIESVKVTVNTKVESR